MASSTASTSESLRFRRVCDIEPPLPPLVSSREGRLTQAVGHSREIIRPAQDDTLGESGKAQAWVEVAQQRRVLGRVVGPTERRLLRELFGAAMEAAAGLPIGKASRHLDNERNCGTAQPLVVYTASGGSGELKKY